MKKQKNIDEIINEMTKKYHCKDKEKLAANWYYQDGVVFWTDIKCAVKISGIDKIDGVSDKLYFHNIMARPKTDDDARCPAYDRVFPTDISDYKEMDIVRIDEEMPIKDRQIQWTNKSMLFISDGYSPMFWQTNNDEDIKTKVYAWQYKMVCDVNCRCYNGKLYYKYGYPLYYRGEYGDIIIEIVIAPRPIDKDYDYPKWDNKETEETEEEMQEEVECERERNEEPQEELNDRHEEEQEEEEKDTQGQEELPYDTDVYDIVFNYLIKNSCIPTGNGSGGLNIDCPYQKREIFIIIMR